MVGVAAVYAVGRRLWDRSAGIAAAAVLAFAFLPVAYSRFALSDVGVFAPVALALLAAIRIHEGAGRRWYVAGGAAVGLAVGFKYTAGLLVVPLAVAAVMGRSADNRELVRRLALAAAVMAAVFLVTTPFFLLDVEAALYQLKVQARAADMPKLGQAADGKVPFYLTSLTWGLGWGALLAAAGGLASEARRDLRRALLLALFPVLLFLYLSTAGRQFARWLMPAYPVLALLAGVGLARLAGAVTRRPVLRALALAGLLAAVMAQPVAAGLRTGRLLGRDDTRQQARDFLVRTLPAGTRLVVEPAVPLGFLDDRFTLGFGPPPKAKEGGAGSPTRFIRTLRPARIDRYRRAGFCVVVSMSLIRERALAGGRPAVAAYYRRLDRESDVIFAASPYRAGAEPVPFDFDLSTHLYEPRAFERPGPEVAIHRLRGCPAPGPAR